MADIKSTVSGNGAGIQTILRRIEAAAQPLYVHVTGQALAWYTLATHDLTKWESAFAVLGTALLTAGIAKIKAWLG